MAEPTHASPPSAVKHCPNSDRLDSWKEISAYLKRNVTTVQRWEKREGMPVHRHLHDRLGSVYASRAELEVWMRRRHLPTSEEIELEASSPVWDDGYVTAADKHREIQTSQPRTVRLSMVLAAVSACVLLATAGWLAYTKWYVNAPSQTVQRAFTRLTSDDGLQTGVTWSPDGRFIAYASDHGGKYEIWVQQISGGDPIQITKGPAANWMPDWSPDGKYIAYRSEEGEGGIYITPAQGGKDQQRKVASFGYYPHWSPDSSMILLQQTGFLGKKIYVVGLDGRVIFSGSNAP